jgi:hypothetical protein
MQFFITLVFFSFVISLTSSQPIVSEGQNEVSDNESVSSETSSSNTATFSDIKTEFFERLRTTKQVSMYGLLVDTNLTCLNERLKDLRGDEKISNNLGLVALTTASILCHGNTNKIYDKLFIITINGLRSNDIFREDLECIKLRLTALEPTSDLLDGFSPSEGDIKKCEQKPDVLAKTLENMKKDKAFGSCSHDDVVHEEDVKEAYRRAVVALTEDNHSEKMTAAKLRHRERSRASSEIILECSLNGIKNQ